MEEKRLDGRECMDGREQMEENGWMEEKGFPFRKINRINEQIEQL